MQMVTTILKGNNDKQDHSEAETTAKAPANDHSVFSQRGFLKWQYLKLSRLLSQKRILKVNLKTLRN